MRTSIDMPGDSDAIIVWLPITLGKLAERLGHAAATLMRIEFDVHGTMMLPDDRVGEDQVRRLARHLGLRVEVLDAAGLGEPGSERSRRRKRLLRRRLRAIQHANPALVNDAVANGAPHMAPPGAILVRRPITLHELAERMRRRPAALIKVAFEDFGMMLVPGSLLDASQIERIAAGLCVVIQIEGDELGPPEQG